MVMHGAVFVIAVTMLWCKARCKEQLYPTWAWGEGHGAPSERETRDVSPLAIVPLLLSVVATRRKGGYEAPKAIHASGQGS